MICIWISELPCILLKEPPRRLAMPHGAPSWQTKFCSSNVILWCSMQQKQNSQECKELIIYGGAGMYITERACLATNRRIRLYQLRFHGGARMNVGTESPDNWSVRKPRSQSPGKRTSAPPFMINEFGNYWRPIRSVTIWIENYLMRGEGWQQHRYQHPHRRGHQRKWCERKWKEIGMKGEWKENVRKIQGYLQGKCK